MTRPSETPLPKPRRRRKGCLIAVLLGMLLVILLAVIALVDAPPPDDADLIPAPAPEIADEDNAYVVLKQALDARVTVDGVTVEDAAYDLAAFLHREFDGGNRAELSKKTRIAARVLEANHRVVKLLNDASIRSAWQTPEAVIASGEASEGSQFFQLWFMIRWLEGDLEAAIACARAQVRIGWLACSQARTPIEVIDYTRWLNPYWLDWLALPERASNELQRFSEWLAQQESIKRDLAEIL